MSAMPPLHCVACRWLCVDCRSYSDKSQSLYWDMVCKTISLCLHACLLLFVVSAAVSTSSVDLLVGVETVLAGR
jgi:hypothetical protein